MADGSSAPLVIGRSACAYPVRDAECMADAYDEEEIAIAYDDLRRVRRSNRIARVDRFDVFYKAYITAGVGALALYTATGWIGDKAISSNALSQIVDIGAPWLGLLVALAIAIGFRSGGRGGPLAFELADVRHVLHSPVDRFRSIRKPAIRYILHVMFLGMCAGAAVGLVAGRRMPQHIMTWVLCTSVFGALVGAVGAGVAMLASGIRISRPLCDVLGLLFFAWSASDIWFDLRTSPATWLGAVVLWPASATWYALVGVVFVIATVAFGIFVSNRCSMEAAERRSKLVGQLQFAATMQDLRTVMVLQRQLAQEQLRQRASRRRAKNAEVPEGSGLSVRSPGDPMPTFSTATGVRRTWRGYRHWPFFRIARLLMLVALAALSLVGVWHGTSALIVVTGVLIWIAALDLVEPLAQEFDYPDRKDSTPHSQGRVGAGLLVVPYFVLFVLFTIAALILVRFLDPALSTTFLPIAIVAAACAVGGAATVVVKQPGSTSGFVDTPETAGMRMAWRVAAPPAVSVIGVLPIAIAQRSWSIHHDVVQMAKDMNLVYFLAMSLAMLTFGFVRYGAEIRTAAETNAKVQQQKAEKSVEESKARKARKAQRAQSVTSGAATAAGAEAVKASVSVQRKSGTQIHGGKQDKQSNQSKQGNQGNQGKKSNKSKKGKKR